MIVYIFKRLIAMIPTLLGITLITFLLINLAPGDPIATSFGAEGADQAAGASGSGSATQGSQDDIIKAKKKLLGMVREDTALHLYVVDGVGLDGPAPIELDGRLGELDAWAQALDASADGQRLVAGTKSGVVYGLAGDGEVLWQVPAHAEAVWSVALSPDASRVAAGDIDGALVLLDAATGAELARADSLNTTIYDVEWLDADRLVSAGADGRVRVHRATDLVAETVLDEHLNGVYALEVSADGASLWSGGYDRVLRAWDTATWQVVATHEDHSQGITDIALSPDGTQLLTASDDKQVRVVSLADFAAEPRVLGGHYKSVSAVAWAPDGRTAWSGGRDDMVRRWDLSAPPGSAAAELGRAVEATGKIYDLVAMGDGVLGAGDRWREVPLVIRYFKWLWRTVRFDFDRSFIDDRLVMDKISEALPITIYLNLIAITIIYVFSIPLGVIAAVRRGGVFDQVSSFVLFLLYSIPNFWLATLLILAFSSKNAWNILPSVGLISDNADDLSYLQWLGDGALHLVLPIICMVYAGFASLSRYARTSMLETIKEDYVRTARAKGLSERVVVFKHAFRNSLITIVTLVANLLPRMIGGSIIIEYIFTIEGMGKLGFDAILARDYPVIMAIVTFSAILTLVGILISDLLYSVVDPRVTVD